METVFFLGGTCEVVYWFYDFVRCVCELFQDVFSGCVFGLFLLLLLFVLVNRNWKLFLFMTEQK